MGLFGRSKEKPSGRDPRETYDASYFEGTGLFTNKQFEIKHLLWNALMQGEVHRLDSKDQLASIADSLAKLVETQQALLETQRAILEAVRLPAADLDKLNRASFFRAGPTPSL